MSDKLRFKISFFNSVQKESKTESSQSLSKSFWKVVYEEYEEKKREVLQLQKMLQLIKQDNQKKWVALGMSFKNIGEAGALIELFDAVLVKFSQLDDGVLSQTTTLVKNMNLSSGKCKHTNVIRIVRTQNESDSPEPKITTSTTQQEGITLKRITEIRYMKLKYIVQDRYEFEGNPEKTQNQKLQERSFISSSQDSGNSNQSNHQNGSKTQRIRNKKICLFQKTARNGNRFLKRNTKNIPKNFCKAFANFMDHIPNKETQEWNLTMRDFKKIEKRNKFKYNNILMHKILSNSRICIYFKQFLENYAADWINNSKISDKQVHVEAIQIYSKLLNNLAYAQVDPSPSDQ